MSQLSTDIGAHAPGHRLACDGTTYEFRHLTFADLTEFEREHYRIKREALGRDRVEVEADFGAEGYEEMRRDLRRRYDRNGLTLDQSPAFAVSGEGLDLLLRLMLPDTTAAEREALQRARGPEVIALIILVVKESLPQAEEVSKRP